MSGGISLPYLFNRGNEKLAGFIAVAPVGGPDPANVANFKKVTGRLEISWNGFLEYLEFYKNHTELIESIYRL